MRRIMLGMEILLGDKQSVQPTHELGLNKPEFKQLELLSDPEREQFERNKDFLRERVKQIPGEIERETTAVRARSQKPQARMFPVAVTFLVSQRYAKV